MKKKLDFSDFEKGDKKPRMTTTSQSTRRDKKETLDNKKTDFKSNTPKTERSQGQFTFANSAKRSTVYDSLDEFDNVDVEDFSLLEKYQQERKRLSKES